MSNEPDGGEQFQGAQPGEVKVDYRPLDAQLFDDATGCPLPRLYAVVKIDSRTRQVLECQLEFSELDGIDASHPT